MRKRTKINPNRRQWLTLLISSFFFLSWMPSALAEKPETVTMKVDAQKSKITWRGTKVTGKSNHGHILPASSTVTLVAGEISEAQIVFDMKSLTVINLEGKLGKKFLGHLQSEDFFEVEKYPTATWKLDSTKGGVAQGTLTVKGKSHPIAIPFQKKGETYVGKVTFDRTKYGIVYRSGNFFKDLGDKMIKDDVEIGFELVLVQ